MIILGGVVNLSVAHLFFAGIMAGAMMAVAMMIVIYLEAKKDNIPFEPKQSSSQLAAAFRESIWALLIPVIILGGIKIGAFTATEGAVVAVVYCSIISVFVYKEVKPKDFIHIGIKAATTTGAIMFLIGMSALFAWVTAREQIPDLIMQWVIGFSDSPYVFLLLVNVVVLIFGAVLEGAPAVIILAPLLLPVAVKLGIDPIHFGTLMIANIGVGYLLPPIGICLLIACSVGKVRVVDVMKPIMPYFTAMVIALLLITYIPDISLFIPKLFGYQPLK
jgi:C4-dicarboxylate transporter DctM subunit